ncbi:MAG: hypothetical protein QM756_23075 [Polyangiaceae bacterium]
MRVLTRTGCGARFTLFLFHLAGCAPKFPLAAALALAVSAALPGCMLEHDECDEGEARCDGSIARVCTAHESEDGARRLMRWSSRDCGSNACVTAQAALREAFCALSAKPDERCEDGGDASSCDGNALVSCHLGYATDVHACSGACISLEGMTDYCREAPPAEVKCVSGDGCMLVGDRVTATSGQAPGAVCSVAEFSAPTGSKVYAYSCRDGLLVSRDLCEGSCVSTTECTTHCKELVEPAD